MRRTIPADTSDARLWAERYDPDAHGDLAFRDALHSTARETGRWVLTGPALREQDGVDAVEPLHACDASLAGYFVALLGGAA
jgi:hypothetical protein